MLAIVAQLLLTSAVFAESAEVIKYHNYTKAIEFKDGSTRVVLCPQAGGRVIEYSRNGKNALYFADEEKAWKPGAKVPMSAGRFDIGPEQIIPRHPLLWSGEWSGQITGKQSARLTSKPDPATGVQLIRDFKLDKGSRLTITQTIKNVSKTRKQWCYWSRTFATGNGTCIIPLSDSSRFPNKYVMYEPNGLINMRPVDPKIKVNDGYLQITGVPRQPKLGFDSYVGWMAYVTRDNLLFVKRFKTDTNAVYNEVAGLTISVWYPEDRRVELEPIGPRQQLEPGEQSSFSVEWWLTDFDYQEGAVNTNDLQKVTKGLFGVSR
ncbi:MAG: hypothetical protein CMJ78_17020 [Planctomycetaceae bacterium]|nr:hypothetical protein [Planctomycetaceae bacterium]